MSIELQKAKFFAVTPPGAIVDNASWTTNVIDTAGWDYLVVSVKLGAMDIAMSALKLQEADAASSATALTSGADISGAVGGTDFTLPTATDDNKFVNFYVNLLGRKRYIDLVATGGDGTTGTYLDATAILSRGKISPDNVTARGILAQVII